MQSHPGIPCQSVPGLATGATSQWLSTIVILIHAESQTAAIPPQPIQSDKNFSLHSQMMMSWHNLIFIVVIVMVFTFESQQMTLPTNKANMNMARSPRQAETKKDCKLKCSGIFKSCKSQAGTREDHIICMLSQTLCNEQCDNRNTLQKIAKLLDSIHTTLKRST